MKTIARLFRRAADRLDPAQTRQQSVLSAQRQLEDAQHQLLGAQRLNGTTGIR